MKKFPSLPGLPRISFRPLLAGMLAVLGLIVETRARELQVEVDVEEVVYRTEPADNGAGPMWCAGSTCIVRVGDVVYASGLETVPGWKPLNNCRWVLWRRDAQGWTRLHVDDAGRTREPSPIARVGSEVFLSANPTLLPPDAGGGGPARPEMFRWARGSTGLPERQVPTWQGQPKFSEHSYRSLASDPHGSSLVLFQNIDYTHAEWTLLDREGRSRAAGQIRWPWGADYAKPQPIRICYPNVALRGNAVHFFGVSDILDPNPAFREFKRQLTGREWDYDFRRLFYTSTPDITRQPFSPWIEVASREATCGWLWPCDLAMPRGDEVWVLWTERAIDERLRERFFPDAKQSHSLNLARLGRDGVERRRTLLESGEGSGAPMATAARFHLGPNRRWFVLTHVSDPKGTWNELLELDRQGETKGSVRVPWEKPMASYFTSTPRAGGEPSEFIDLLGHRQGEAGVMRYARLRVR